MTLAMIERLPTGLLLWVSIGGAIGYVFGLFTVKDRGLANLLPMAAGVLGALIGGLGLGLTLNGYKLWECNLAAVIGACLLALAYQWYARPKPIKN